jgi:hypothetical protein
MFYYIYNYATIYTSSITFLSYIITLLFPSNLIHTLIFREFNTRLKLSLGQFLIHKYYLIPARKKYSFAKFLPSYLFYPSIMICNMGLIYFIDELNSSIQFQLYHKLDKDSLGLTKYMDGIVLIIWIYVLLYRIISYVFAMTRVWFKLKWEQSRFDSL